MTMDSRRYFTLFACCKLVKGAKRSIICDLQRNDFIFVPNFFFDLLQKDENEIDLTQLPEHIWESTTPDDFENLITSCVNKEYAFFTDDPSSFPSLSLKDLSNIRISNAIVDIDEKCAINFPFLAKELTFLGCSTMLLRFHFPIEYGHITDLLKPFLNSTIRSIELHIPYSSQIDTKEKIIELAYSNNRIKGIIVHSTGSINQVIEEKKFEVMYTEEILTMENCCGKVSPYYFRSNPTFFFESQKNNSCLNKKISIDVNGHVKNCPSMKEGFGKYSEENNLMTIIEKNNFTKIWSITKDMVEVCKDCEFRYICTDCRAITKEDSLYSKPKSCSYNPYEAVWEN